MRLLKKSFVLLLVLALVFAFVACGNDDITQEEQNSNDEQSAEVSNEAEEPSAEEQVDTDEQLEFMFCAPKTDDPIWLVAKEGFDAAAQDFGFEGIWTGCIDHTVEGTVQALEATIASQPDGIVACPIAPPAFTNTLQKAVDNDIPLISLILKPESNDLRTAWIGADFTKAGLTSIKEIHETLGTDEIKLGVLVSNMDVDIQIEQYDAAVDYMEDLEGAEMVEILVDLADPIESNRLVTDLLSAHPEVNALQSTESGGTPGVGLALKDLGLTDKVVAVCSDDTDINLDTLREGSIHGVTAQDFWGMGYLAGKFLYMNAHGMEIPDEYDTGVILVTQENIDTYAIDRDADHETWREEAEEIIAQVNGK